MGLTALRQRAHGPGHEAWLILPSTQPSHYAVSCLQILAVCLCLSSPVHCPLQEEAKDAFKELLAVVNCRADWSWEQAMRATVNDPR